MYYTIYKITNLINGKIYVGQHTTENLYDSYMGSGRNIKYAIKKYGKQHFLKEILYVFDNFEDMNKMEGIIVNEEFVKRRNTYNVCIGGIFTEQPPSQIGVVAVIDTELNINTTIDRETYHNNKDRYVSHATGKITIYNKETGISSSIPMSAFDPTIHKSVFGGIVIKRNGSKQYITKDEFYSGDYDGIHKGKITVKILETGEIKHVDVNEYHKHPELYESMSKGIVTARNKETGKFSTITQDEFYSNRDLWDATTKGERTVFDIETNQWKNIPKERYDKTIHRMAFDKKFICYDENENELFTYWGSKQDFIKEYGIPETLWWCLLENRTFYTKRNPNKKFNGWHFKLIDWKKELGV